MPVTFDTITVGSQWDRTQLAKLWGKGREGLDCTVFTPKNDNKIILLIGNEKQRHAKQFNDKFDGDTIQMDGQPKHRTDNRLIHAAERGDEIHLFYRERIKEPFIYKGQVEVDHQKSKIHTDQPSKFFFSLRSSADELADSTLVTDIKKIISNETTDPTTTQALVNARVGQGKFGLAVRQLWNHRCSVTGASTKAALEASHIQRWADSNDAQRLDPNNGLLLTANLHKLFDAGLISFDDSGKMLVSSKLSQSEQEIFGVVGKKLSKKPPAETANYLSYHRTKFLE
jgi:hypothetical protein